MHLFRKVSAVLYCAVISVFLAVLIAYLLGFELINPLSMVTFSMYIIGVEFDLLADLSEAKSPFKGRMGKMLLALDLIMTLFLLFVGLFCLFFGDTSLGTPLTVGGIIAIILVAKILRLSKFPPKQESQSQI